MTYSRPGQTKEGGGSDQCLALRLSVGMGHTGCGAPPVAEAQRGLPALRLTPLAVAFQIRPCGSYCRCAATDDGPHRTVPASARQSPDGEETPPAGRDRMGRSVRMHSGFPLVNYLPVAPRG
jgi:hypothetical protein